MYVELHAHSYYSLLDGASSPLALVEQAAALGMPALALTDHDNVYGAVAFTKAAQAAGIKPIYGAEVSLEDEHHLTLLVENHRGWANLCQLITQAQHNAPKGEAALPLSVLENHTTGLIALSGCRQGAISQALRNSDQQAAQAAAEYYCSLFGANNFWIELQSHLLPGERRLHRQQVKLAERLGLGYVATNNVHYAEPAGHRLQDVLVTIAHLETLDDCRHLRPNAEFYLKNADDMSALFARYPDAIGNTLRLAERCDFVLEFCLQDLPEFPSDGRSPAEVLRELCQQALTRRYDDASAAAAQLDHELQIITDSGLANYFLVVWDIVRFAREQGIRCQGRGSAANSIVAYLLDISPVDPLAHDLVFERFLSSERQVVPDIDIDFDAARREEVIQYVYHHYGHEHVAMACTFVTFRRRSAMRDIAKVLGLPPEAVHQGLKILEADEPELDHPWDQVMELVEQLRGLPRHVGLHNGGMVTMCAPLADRVPIEPATMADRYVVQWDKESLEDAGLVKIDVLGLRMLSLISQAAIEIERQAGNPIDFSRLRFDDPAVYDMICRADTIGVFQVESGAQRNMLPRMQPRAFHDLIVAISLIRPGPLQGNMVHPYLKRRLGVEPIQYPHPVLEDALSETLGVILFQEQVLKVAQLVAGFTPGQGELLRRALSSKNATAAIDQLRDVFIKGAVANDVSYEDAAEVFENLRAFGGYSFAKSHATAFAVLVYQSAWIKHYYSNAFFTALLNNQPMGFWSPSVVVNAAKREGVEFLGVDVNASDNQCTVEEGCIRMGFTYIDGLGEAQIQRIMDARDTPFLSLADFARRTGLSRRAIENLIMTGALDAFDADRRKLVWELGTLDLAPGSFNFEFPLGDIELPSLTHLEQMQFGFELMGVSLGEHPLELVRSNLAAQNILSSEDVETARAGAIITVAGAVVRHQAPPTAHGHRFITLEDEWGFINVIVKPHVYPNYKRFLHTATMMAVRGTVQREGAVTNVVATKFRRLSSLS